MIKTCKVNHFITNSLAIAIQIGFIFSFLTIFFFMYVQKVEKNEFKNQLEIIVDNFFDDVKDTNEIVNIDNINVDDTIVITNGFVDLLEEKAKISSKKEEDEIGQQNNKIKKKAKKYLIFTLSLIVIFAILLYFLQFCIPIKLYIKEAIIIVIFVALTEFTFLQLIAKNYISASPNKIKGEIANKIKLWIKKNKNI